MKHYRNVKVKYDPTVDQKETDEYDDMIEVRGGMEIPGIADIPAVKIKKKAAKEEEVEEIEEEEIEEIDDELDVELDEEALEIADDDDDDF